ncbi:hypothetical protein GDO81_003091 [Engystomops pustulosus]|uniref:Uncharacterized protein n=1 Tax=Engystomops pustulosus TaxID=76066 RepID=A0AAV6ZTW7_ENGPU|nr:hypothetical protein GDO81_003091 [Engystomops pustulosus]
MNTFISLAFIVLLSCNIGYALKCYYYVKDYEVMRDMPCGKDQDACLKSFSYGEVKGCGRSEGCTEENNCFSCKTDLCNSAVSPRTSLLLSVTALVVLWVGKVY